MALKRINKVSFLYHLGMDMVVSRAELEEEGDNRAYVVPPPLPSLLTRPLDDVPNGHARWDPVLTSSFGGS